MKEPVLSFKLSNLAEILHRENSLIASNDVARLLKVLLEEKGFPIPETIAKAITEANIEEGIESE